MRNVSEPLEKKVISPLEVWNPNLDLALPIRGEDIPGFDRWVNWNEFSELGDNHEGHPGFDFAAYINKRGRCILGLPPETPIRAIADGVVNGFGYGEPYCRMVGLNHGNGRDQRIYYKGSEYVHVVPLVEKKQPVKKGDIIAALYRDPGAREGRLVHLHFQLYYWTIEDVENIGTRDYADPSTVYLGIDQLKANPQDSLKFKILGRSRWHTKVYIANFRRLRFSSNKTTQTPL